MQYCNVSTFFFHILEPSFQYVAFASHRSERLWQILVVNLYVYQHNNPSTHHFVIIGGIAAAVVHYSVSMSWTIANWMTNNDSISTTLIDILNVAFDLKHCLGIFCASSFYPRMIYWGWTGYKVGGNSKLWMDGMEKSHVVSSWFCHLYQPVMASALVWDGQLHIYVSK